MTKADTIKIREILKRIKDPDGHIQEAIAICDKEIARFNKMRGQLREQYDDADLGRW